MFTMLAQGGIVASLFAREERRRFGEELSRLVPPHDPVFIVGHWRTGTTYLQQLLSRHPALTTPTILQCSYPDGFVVAGPRVTGLMARAVKGHRPMDNVRVGPDEPQEDEYALLKLSGFSPLERLLFPRSDRYYLLDAPFLPDGEIELAAWKQALASFISKLRWHTGRRVVSKNPFHSMRVPVLREVFPAARFIHITRDPVDVIPSTLHLWNVVAPQNAMRPGFRPPTSGEVLEVFDRVESTLERDLAAVPPEHRTSVRFSRLEKSPLEETRRVCETLGIGFDERAEARVLAFLATNRGYEKNRYDLSDADRELITSRTPR